MTGWTMQKSGSLCRKAGMLLLSLSLFLPAGCALFSSKPPPSPDGDYVERVAQPRTEEQLKRKELVLALWDGPEKSKETAAVRAALQAEPVRLKIVTVSRRETLSPMLRSGRADLIAGAFTQEEIRNLYLLPVLVYSGTDGRSSYCFAVRRGDHILEGMLGPVSDAEKTSDKKEKKP